MSNNHSNDKTHSYTKDAHETALSKPFPEPDKKIQAEHNISRKAHEITPRKPFPDTPTPSSSSQKK